MGSALSRQHCLLHLSIPGKFGVLLMVRKPGLVLGVDSVQTWRQKWLHSYGTSTVCIVITVAFGFGE